MALPRNAIIALCLLPFLFSNAYAYKFTPVTLNLSPAAKKTSQFYTVDNDSTKPLALEISIKRFTQSMDGEPVLLDDDAMKDFMVYPTRMVLMPGESRMAQVTWIGDLDIKETKSYYIICHQVAIPLPEEKKDEQPDDGARIKAFLTILMDYRCTIYVNPPELKPLPAVESVSGWDGPGSTLEVVCSNKGNSVADLRQYELIIEPKNGGGGPLLFGYNEYCPKKLVFSLLPGASLRIQMPWPESLPKAPFAAEFKPAKR